MTRVKSSAALTNHVHADLPDSIWAAGSIEIGKALKQHGASVIFTDLPAGSCTLAARRIARLDSSISIVTGATVAMVLDFALGAGAAEPDLRRAAESGRAAIVVYPASGGAGGN